jgi:hypothetical protein
MTCDMYYSPNLTKQYTVLQKQYALKGSNESYFQLNGPGGLQDDISPLLWILLIIEPPCILLINSTISLS